MALKYFISILWGIFFSFSSIVFCRTFLFPFKVLSNCNFFYKKGVRVDVGFVMKEKKNDTGDRSQSFLGFFIHDNSLKRSKHISLLVWLIYLLINASAVSSPHARSRCWVAMVTQNFGPKSDIKIYLISFTGFNPHSIKWGPMRPHFIINIYHSSHGCVSHLECKYYIYFTFGYGNVGVIFLLVSKSTPATKTLAMTVTTKIKNKRTKPN